MRLTPEREKEIRKRTAKDYDQCLFCVELLAEIDALRADLIVEESLKVMAQKNLAQLKAENERLKEPIVAITDGPIVNENITIDTRYKFECEIKRLKARIEKLREALEYYTSDNRLYVAQRALAQDDKDKGE